MTSVSQLRARQRVTQPAVEALEAVCLMSGTTTLTYTATLPPAIVINLPRTTTLPQFDPALGTLISTQVTMAGLIDTHVDATSTGTSVETVSATTTGSYTFTGQSFNPVVVGPQSQTETRSVPPGGSASFDVLVNPPEATVTLTTVGQLLPYLGTGTVAFTFDPRATAKTTGSGNVRAQAITNASATVTVVYEYQPPPRCITVDTQVLGAHQQPTPIVLTFGDSIDAAQATNLANYTLVAFTHQVIKGTSQQGVIPIQSATYDPTAHTVTLVPSRRLHENATFQLTVNQAVAGNGDTLHGLDGSCGDYSVLINRGTHVPVLDQNADRVSLGVSPEGWLTILRSPDGTIGQVVVQNVYSDFGQLDPSRSILTGNVRRSQTGTGPVVIPDLIGGNHVRIAFKTPALQVAHITPASLPPISVVGSKFFFHRRGR